MRASCMTKFCQPFTTPTVSHEKECSIVSWSKSAMCGEIDFISVLRGILALGLQSSLKSQLSDKIIDWLTGLQLLCLLLIPKFRFPDVRHYLIDTFGDRF